MEDGTPVHAPSNLKVLCAACHDRQHLFVKQGRPADELATIHAFLKKYKTATLKALVYQLKSEHNIDISSKALSAERAKMI